MKYLFLLSLFALVAFLVYWRLRPYIHAARRAMSVFRQMQTGAVNQGVGKKAEARAVTEGQLVKCAHCGTWVLQARALRLSDGPAAYCSRACLESGAVKNMHGAAVGDER